MHVDIRHIINTYIHVYSYIAHLLMLHCEMDGCHVCMHAALSFHAPLCMLVHVAVDLEQEHQVWVSDKV